MCSLAVYFQDRFFAFKYHLDVERVSELGNVTDQMGNTFVINRYIVASDVLTPPTLTLRTSLVNGLCVTLFSRDHETIAKKKRRTWIWMLGEIKTSMRQSCVEDEIRVSIGELSMMQAGEEDFDYYDLIRKRIQRAAQLPLISFTCVVPAYQSRLVGHQPVMKEIVNRKIVLAIKDEALVMWMTIFAPV